MRDAMLITHFIGLAMGVGTGIAYMILGISSSKLNEDEAKDLFIKTMPISKMGHIGLFLLLVSGGYLMTPYWEVLTDTPLLMAKLALYLVLGGLIGVMSSTMKKVKRDNGGPGIQKVENLGKITLPLGIIIVILAVLIFH